MALPPAATAPTRSAAWLDARFLARAERMLADLAGDRVPATRALAVGVGPGELQNLLRDRFGPALSSDPTTGPHDLVIAVGQLATAGVDRVRELDALTTKHLLLVEHRKPFARGAGYTLPGLQRLVSQVMSVREVATPFPLTLLWAVKA